MTLHRRVSSALRGTRGKWLIAGVVVIATALVAAREVLSDELPHGVHVLGLDLSRKEPAEAQAEVARVARERLTGALTVEVDGRTRELSPHVAGFGFDAAATLSRLRAPEADRTALARSFGWLRRFVSPAYIEPAFTVDRAKLDAALDSIERELLAVPNAGGFRLEGARFVAIAPRAGKRLQRSGARGAIEDALETGSARVRLESQHVPALASPEMIDELTKRANALAAARVVLSEPDLDRSLTLEPSELRAMITSAPPTTPGATPEISVDSGALERALGERRAALESAPVDARFVIEANDQVRIVPSQPGAHIDMRALAGAVLAAAAAPERRGTLPIQRDVEPAFTTVAAEKLGIRGLVSTFTTRHPCCERRVDNIHRIADLLDGLLVKPGETVSVNAIIGPRTAKNGFVPAPAIEAGEMVDSIGGGISQFATTLFNALFHGGYDIVERQPHTYWFARYPMGHEATLSYPKPDLIFRNDTEAGMLIDTVYGKTSITVRIFGDNGGRKVKAVVSPRQDVVEPGAEIVPNSAVPPDEEQVKDAGMVGWSVNVGRIITFPDGTQKEERRKVTYRPRPRRIEVHPCRVPKGEKGYTGERCPEPEDSGEVAAAPQE